MAVGPRCNTSREKAFTPHTTCRTFSVSTSQVNGDSMVTLLRATCLTV
nr:MAG TPA: hypothetical protein [Caudoviricetes sp.]